MVAAPALDGLVDDVAGDREQQEGVGQGGEDLQPVPAVGAVRGGAPAVAKLIAANDMPRPPASESMCPASESSASEPDWMATMNWTATNARVSRKAISGAPVAGSRGHRPSGAAAVAVAVPLAVPVIELVTVILSAGWLTGVASGWGWPMRRGRHLSQK